MGEIPRPSNIKDSTPQTDSAVKSGQMISYDENEGAIVIDGKRVKLSKTESQIFTALYSQPGNCLSRDQITLIVYETIHISKRVVDVHLSSIGKKIRKVSPNLYPFKTVRGFGYKYVGAEEDSSPNSDIS